MKMRWNKSLTAEEVALIVFDLQSYKTLEEAKTGSMHYLDDAENTYAHQCIVEEAQELYEALIDQIVIQAGHEKGYGEEDASLKIVKYSYKDEPHEEGLAPEKCTVTKNSLALWFHDMGDERKAKICDPHYMTRPAVDNHDSAVIADEPNPKSKNSYLKTILALSDALIDGLTGKPSTDAQAVMSRLADKGVDCPFGEKTLSNYLKEARKLID